MIKILTFFKQKKKFYIDLLRFHYRIAASKLTSYKTFKFLIFRIINSFKL